MILSILGAYLASSGHHKQRLAGFCIWIFTNFAIGLMFWQSGNIPQTITFAAYEICNIKGIFANLTRKDTNDKRHI